MITLLQKNIAKAGVIYINNLFWVIYPKSSVLHFLREFYFARVAHSIVRDLRNDSFKNLQKIRDVYFDKTPVGSVVSRLTNDTQALQICLERFSLVS